MRSFYLRFRVYAIQIWPFFWNLSSNYQSSLVFLYSNSLYGVYFWSPYPSHITRSNCTLKSKIKRWKTWFSFGRICLFLLFAFRNGHFVVRIFFNIIIVKNDNSFPLPFRDICWIVVFVIDLRDWLCRIFEEFLTLNSQSVGPIVDAIRIYVFILIKKTKHSPLQKCLIDPIF